MSRLLKLALPIALQSLIAVGMNMADTLMLHDMGQTVLSAASFGGQITTFFLILAMGLGMGAGVLTTRYWGSGDLLRLRQAVTLLLRWELCLTVAFAGLVLLLPDAIMGLFTRDSAVIRQGTDYLRCLLPAWFAMAASQSCTIVLRSAGKLAVAVAASVLGLGLNVLGNWLLIPTMGIVGAGIATTGAWTAQAVVVCGWFFLAEQDVGYRLRDLRGPVGDLRRDYLCITLPVLVSDGLLGLGNTAMSMVMGHMGTDVSAANAVATVIWQLSAVLHHGLAGAAGVMIGHSLGRSDRETARHQGQQFTWLGVAVGVAASGIILLLRRPVIDYYELTPAAEDIARGLLMGLVWTVVLQSVSGVLTKGVLRAGGDTRFLLWADVLFLWVLALPLGLWGAARGASAPMVYLLLRADLPLKCLLCLWRLHSGKWMQRV